MLFCIQAPAARFAVLHLSLSLLAAVGTTEVASCFILSAYQLLPVLLGDYHQLLLSFEHLVAMNVYVCRCFYNRH